MNTPHTPTLLEVAQMAASSIKVDEIALMQAARDAIKAHEESTNMNTPHTPGPQGETINSMKQIETTLIDGYLVIKSINPMNPTQTLHTPGKWRVEPTQDNHGETTSIVSAGGIIVANIPSPAWGAKPKDKTKQAVEDWHNARLIASAPTLLSQRNELREALQVIVDAAGPEVTASFMWPRIGKVFDQARATLNSMKD